MIKNQVIDEYGNMVFRELGLIEQMYYGVKPDQLNTDSQIEVNLYNKYIDKFAQEEPKLDVYEKPNESVEQYHRQRQGWIMPGEYQQLDLLEWFAQRISTDQQMQRVAMELDLYRKHNFEQVLRFLIYLVDQMRDNEIIWGVGRGSSVASYCLYLIGIHRIDSLKYGLDIKEFLK